MRNGLLLLMILVSIKISAQELTGKWKVLQVSNDKFLLDVKTDSITFSKEIKRHSAVSRQDRSAAIRTNYGTNIFIFGENASFRLYTADNPRTLIFDGTYEVQNANKILLHVVNRAKQNVETEAEFYFKDSKLYLRMYSSGNSWFNYILEKVQE